MSDDMSIDRMRRNRRLMRLTDGPDDVHKMAVARRDLLRKWAH